MEKKKGIMEAIKLGAGEELAGYSTKQLQEELERRKEKENPSVGRKNPEWVWKILAEVLVAMFSGAVIVLVLVFVICAGYAC